MNLVKRFFVFALMLTTVFSMSAFTLNVQAAGNYAAGSLLALEDVDGSAVYYIGSDGMKYVFPDPKTYATWYENFDTVVRVSVTELDLYPDGGAITYRPGTKLVTHANTNNVYAITPGGAYCLLPSEAVAIALYGTDWTSMVQDVIPGFFSSSYTNGNCDLSDTLPDGTVVMMGETYYYIVDGTKRPFASADAFEANNFVYDFAMEVDDLAAYADGSSITGEEEGLAGYMSIDVDPVDPVDPEAIDGAVSVSVNGDTPTGTTVPANSSIPVFMFNLSAGSAAVQVNSIKLTAAGLGSATNIDDVTMYVDGVKVGTSKNFNSDREATFNFATPIDLSANATKTVTVKATFAAMGYYQLTIASDEDVNANGGSISGSFPVAGSTFYADSSSVTIGEVVLSSPDSTTVASDFGEDDVLLSSFNMVANNEDALFTSAMFKNGGTNDDDIVTNLTMLIDGTEEATGTYVDGYVYFTLDGYLMEKGNTYSVEVRGDIGIAQVGNSIKLYIKDRADFDFDGVDYGYGVQLTAASHGLMDASTEGMTINLTAGDITIDMDKTATPALDVKAGTSDFVLATLNITSNGENATIDQIVHADAAGSNFMISGTGLTVTEIKNVEMKDVDTGAVYDVTATFDTDRWELSVTDEITLVKGVTKTFEIRADLENSGTPIDNNDTLLVTLQSTAMTITGDVSNAALTDITPSSVVGSTHTVKDAALDWTTVALTSKKVVPSASDVIIYRANLEAGDVDGVKLTSVKLSSNQTTSTLSFSDTNVSALSLYLNGVLLKTKSNAIIEATGSAVATITFNSLPSGTMIPAGETYLLEVKSSYTSSFTLVSGAADTFALELTALADVTAKSETNNDPVGSGTGLTANTGDNSRSVTLSDKGTLKAHLATTDAKADDNVYLLAGNETATDKYLAELVFTTENEDIKIEELRFVNDGNTTANDLETVVLYDADGVEVASKLVTSGGDVAFTSLNIILPADQATSMWLGVKSKALNVDGDPSSTATHARTAQFHFNPSAGVVAKGVDSSAVITMAVDANSTLIQGEWDDALEVSKTATLSGAVLTAITNAGTDGTLTGGTNKIIGEYTFVFENGANRDTANAELKAIFDAFTMSIAKSTAVVLTNVEAYIEGTATKVAADTLTGLGNGSTTGSVVWNATTLQALSDGGAVDGAVTLVIEADVVTTADEYVQSSLADLNGAGGNDDFNFIGDGETGGTAFTNMYLDVADVTGMSLTN